MVEGSGDALLDAVLGPDYANVSDLPGLPVPQGPAPDPVLYAIQLWFTPILVTLGTLGNCLCVIVFFGTKLKKLSSR